MREIRTVVLMSASLAFFAAGCGSDSGSGNADVAKQNADDELKAMENAKQAEKGRKGI